MGEGEILHMVPAVRKEKQMGATVTELWAMWLRLPASTTNPCSSTFRQNLTDWSVCSRGVNLTFIPKEFEPLAGL